MVKPFSLKNMLNTSKYMEWEKCSIDLKNALINNSFGHKLSNDNMKVHGQNAWPPIFRNSFDCRSKTFALRDVIFCMYFPLIVRKIVSKGISDQSYFKVNSAFFPFHVF